MSRAARGYWRRSFAKGLADEICVYIAPKILGADGTAFIGEPMADLMQGIGLEHVQIKTFGDDMCMRGLLADPSIRQSPVEPAAERRIVSVCGRYRAADPDGRADGSKADKDLNDFRSLRMRIHLTERRVCRMI